MRFVIKNPAPLGPNQTKWGDYHFGRSLQRALERRGASVTQQYWPEWSTQQDDGDIIVVLRGKRRFVPPPGCRAFMWVLSHPATVTKEEADAYSIVFAASEMHRETLRYGTVARVEIMRQCTDTELFGAAHVGAFDPCDRRGIVFVANSRGVRRDILRWALENGIHPRVYGRHWAGVGMGEYVVRDYIGNEELPMFYARARLGLNDHWGDMAHFGIINNRVFDSLACGLPTLSDDFPELRAVCGDGLLYADSAANFGRAIRSYTFHYDELLERTRELWSKIGPGYTFDARAEQLIEAATSPGERPRMAAPRVAHDSETGSVASAMEVVFKEAGTTKLKVLHVDPSAGWTHAVLAFEDINYLSAGMGVGPWHVDIDASLDLVPDGTIDLVVLDGRASAMIASDAATKRLNEVLCRKLAHGRFILTNPAVEMSMMLERIGAKPFGEMAGLYKIFLDSPVTGVRS